MKQAKLTNAAQDHLLPNVYTVHKQAFFGKVSRNQELLRNTAQRSTKQIDILLPTGRTYHTGDYLGVFPKNPTQLVQQIARRCGFAPEDVVVLDLERTETSQGPLPLPVGLPVKVKTLLGRYVDLQGPLTREQLQILARCTQNRQQQQQLETMANTASFAQEIRRNKPTLLEMLTRFDTIACSLGTLLALRPLIKPRYYSISSSPLISPHCCSITVAAHTFANAQGDLYQGLCSHYLSHLKPGDKPWVELEKSTFRPPQDHTTDLILIGPGTGLAPFRGFLQERAALKQQGNKVGQSHLYFGCRHPNQDYIYRQELKQFQQEGVLQTLSVAFSRYNKQAKTYVQDNLLLQGKQIWQQVQQGAYIYVCGDARRMAPQVNQTLQQIFAKQGNMTMVKAQQHIGKLQMQKRYLQDVWSEF